MRDEPAVFQHQFDIGKRIRPLAVELDVDNMAANVLEPSYLFLYAFVQWTGDIYFISVITECLEYFLPETVKSAPAVAKDKDSVVIGGHFFPFSSEFRISDKGCINVETFSISKNTEPILLIVFGGGEANMDRI